MTNLKTWPQDSAIGLASQQRMELYTGNSAVDKFEQRASEPLSG